MDALRLEPVLETLTGLDWVQQLNDANATDDARYVLLAEPETTLLAPLAERLLMQPATSVQKIWQNSRMSAFIPQRCAYERSSNSGALQSEIRPAQMSRYITQSPMKL